MTSSVEHYPDNISDEFNVFYKEEKKVLWRAINKLFRRNCAERARLTLEECKDVNGKRVLDIGYGLGYIRAELEKKGALVVGIGLSKDSVVGSKMKRKSKSERNSKSLNEDFMSHVFCEDFDISVALGIFDYIENPLSYVKKMRSITTKKCIMSFPSKFTFSVPLRMIWPRNRNCPIYFYTKRQLKQLFSNYFSHYRIKNISVGYFCVASI